MNKAILIAVAAGAMMAGCDGGEGEAADPAAIADQIRAEERRWVEDWASRDANRVMAHYSDDATVIGAGRLTGAAQIRRVVTAMVHDPNLNMRFTPDRIEVRLGRHDLCARHLFTADYQPRNGAAADGLRQLSDDLQAAGRRQLEGGRRHDYRRPVGRLT